jgi:multiple sugar transport system ATP-binding protein
MRVELRKLIKEMDITCFYVTHDQVEGMTMGDRIVLMNKGKIMQIGTPDELFNQPDNLFTAYFVGEPTVSIIPCLLSEDNGQICLDIDGEKHQLDSLLRKKIETANPGRELYLAIRPQFCSLKSQNSVTEDQNLLFKSVASMIEPLGVEKIVHLTKGDHQLRCVCSVDTPINTGDHCLLQCNPEKIFLFDRKTEKSVIV